MLLMKRQMDSTSLAAENGHVDVAKVLIQNGADVNAVRMRRSTSHGSFFMLTLSKVLIQNGCECC